MGSRQPPHKRAQAKIGGKGRKGVRKKKISGVDPGGHRWCLFEGGRSDECGRLARQGTYAWQENLETIKGGIVTRYQDVPLAGDAIKNGVRGARGPEWNTRY